MDLRAMAPTGVFSAAAARASGIGSALLRTLVSEGKCHPLHRGWYSVERPATDKERHRLRVTALLAEYDGRVMASHGSAIAWLGLPDERIDWGTVHLMWRDGKEPFRAFSRVHIHELIEHAELHHERDVVDVALASVQVGLTDQRSALVVADHALHTGLTSKVKLAAAGVALAGNRGVLRARAAIPWADGRHESPGETLTAFAMRQLGYSFTPQFEIERREKPGHVYFADFLIDETTVLVEFDGKVKYVDADANFEEKLREDELRRLGYRVVRATQSVVNQPRLLRARIESAINAEDSDSWDETG